MLIYIYKHNVLYYGIVVYMLDVTSFIRVVYDFRMNP